MNIPFNLDKVAKEPGLGWFFPQDRVVLEGNRVSTLYGTVPLPSRLTLRDCVHVTIQDADKVDPRIVALLRPFMTGE